MEPHVRNSILSAFNEVFHLHCNSIAPEGTEEYARAYTNMGIEAAGELDDDNPLVA